MRTWMQDNEEEDRDKGGLPNLLGSMVVNSCMPCMSCSQFSLSSSICCSRRGSDPGMGPAAGTSEESERPNPSYPPQPPESEHPWTRLG